MLNTKKLFRSVIFSKPGVTGVIDKFMFSLDLPSNDYKYIELLSYAIHESGVATLYRIDFPGLFDSSLICHSTQNFAFQNFSTGLIFSVDQKQIASNLNCVITPSINHTSNNDILTIVFYFVIHY